MFYLLIDWHTSNCQISGTKITNDSTLCTVELFMLTVFGSLTKSSVRLTYTHALFCICCAAYKWYRFAWTRKCMTGTMFVVISLSNSNAFNVLMFSNGESVDMMRTAIWNRSSIEVSVIEQINAAHFFAALALFWFYFVELIFFYDTWINEHFMFGLWFSWHQRIDFGFAFNFDVIFVWNSYQL